MPTGETKMCEKCQRERRIGDFYTYKDGSKVELCKDCLTRHIDNFDEGTYLWILQKLDVPYVPEEWNVLRDRAYAKNPRLNGKSVIGKYLSKMKLKQWKDYSWADSEKLQQEHLEKQEQLRQEGQQIQEMQQELQEQFNEGKISEAEYKTLTSSATQMTNNALPPVQPPPGYNPYIDMASPYMNEEEFDEYAADLTEEDKTYLAVKWGRLYKASEWVQMEDYYTKMKASFDIHDTDTEGTLILICKVYLKMNKALDSGDVDGFQKLSRVYDTLRKSANFTAAQNKKEDEDFVDCVGEMVAYCEKNGGIIPTFKIEEANQDVIDKIIEDLKGYTRDLIYEDKALAQQIENYLKELKAQEERDRDEKKAEEQGIEFNLKDEDYQEHYERIENEKKQETEEADD